MAGLVWDDSWHCCFGWCLGTVAAVLAWYGGGCFGTVVTVLVQQWLCCDGGKAAKAALEKM